MSGGSHNYLFTSGDESLGELCERLDTMLESLIKHAKHQLNKELEPDQMEAVLTPLTAYVTKLRQAHAEWARFADLMQAIEWADSGDWDSDSVAIEAKKLVGLE